ncbi:MAG: hypothetical protein ACJ8DZ_13765 [Allosphingosinicella sp.]
MNAGARHSQQRSNRVRLKADCVVLLDRLAALGEPAVSARLKLEVAEMRMRLAPPPGIRAPIILTGYTKEAK